MTIAFAALALCLTVIALLPVVVALRRHAESREADQRLAAYRARLAEIDAETRDGAIAADQADSARLEIEHEMLRHVDDKSRVPAATMPRRATAAFVIVLFVGISASGLYLFAGRPDLIGVNTKSMAHPDMEAMVRKITARLQQFPEDKSGWEMLGRTYMTLGRYPEAVGAFEHAHLLDADDPDALVRYADALAMAAGGRLGGRPAELINRALELEPDHRTALWLAGMAAMERGEPANAVSYWQTLLPLLEDQDSRAEVAQLIAQAGGTPQPVPAPAVAAATVAVTVRVELAPGLAGQIPPDYLVFVTARAPDGPPMPLAVVRRPASELPFEVVLDDTLSLSPQHRLSQHETVNLTARISRTGRAERESGDRIGELSAVPVNSRETHRLVINTQVP